MSCIVFVTIAGVFKLFVQPLASLFWRVFPKFCLSFWGKNPSRRGKDSSFA